MLSVTAIEQKADHIINTDEENNPGFASGSALKAVKLLEEAHSQFDHIDSEVAERIGFLENRIAWDQDELAYYKETMKGSRAESERMASYRAAYMRGRLLDPTSRLHEIYRRILLNAEQDRGSLRDRNTFEQAHNLGSALVGFNEYLEASSEPQPLVVVKNIPTPNNPVQGLQIDYGYTSPFEGVKIVDDGEGEIVYGNDNSVKVPQSWLGLETSDKAPTHAVKQSGDNSHFFYDDKRVIKVNAIGARREGVWSDADVAPISEDVRIALPMGSLYPSRANRPLLIHDNDQGATERIVLPENLSGSRGQTVLLVGSIAIIEGLNILPSQVEAMLGEEKGRVARAMVKTVTRKELGIRTVL